MFVFFQLSNCQQLCRTNFPIHQPNLIVHENNGYYNDDSSNFPNNKAEHSLTGEDKKGNKEQVNRSNNDNIIMMIINSSKSSSSIASSSSSHSSAPAANKNNGNNGSNNNNTDNNDEKNIERAYPKEKITLPVEREISSWTAADRKTNNNNYHSRILQEEKVENQEYRHSKQEHYPFPNSLPSSSDSDSERKFASGGGSNDLQPLMKLLAIEQVSEENNNKKKEPHSLRSATSLLNNLKTFPSDPGLKLRQLSLKKGEEKKDEDEDGVATTFYSTPTLQLSLSWPQPTNIHGPRYEDDDDHDKDKNNKPEEADSAQVKDKMGIHFGGGGGKDEENVRIGARPALGNGNSLERNSSGSEKPINLVYSIILEESWEENDEKDGNLDMYPYAQRLQLIDQIVARTTTQISLPLTIVQGEKVLTEQEKNEEKNNLGKMRLSEQTVVRSKRISLGNEDEEERRGSGALEQKKGEIIKVNGNKKNYLMNGMGEKKMMMTTPLPPTLLQQQQKEQQQHQHNLLKKKNSADPPSKVSVRVLAVSRQGLEKVYSAQVKVNNSFWDYHMNEHDHNQQKVYRENLNQTTEKEASWTHAASDRHNNIEPTTPISSSPIAFVATTKFEDDDRMKKEEVDGGGEGRGKETENEKKGVDKLASRDENEKKVETGKKKDENLNESNENSNQILVFPSKESLRQALGGGRGLSGELKVKKLMSRLKQKKKSENEVENRISKLGKPVAKEVERKKGSQGDDDGDQDDYREEKDGNINRMNEVSSSSPKKKISLTDEGSEDKTKDEENWGLHTVSMIYQKFLVVTQVTWDYPGEKDGNQGKGNNILGNNGMTRSGLGNESLFKLAEKTTGKNNISTELPPLSSSSVASPPHKKWRGCGENRASNSNDDAGGGGVDGGNQLNFLLSWEIFGGGLRGNLVTDTCSASISLWPDTAYIIQVRNNKG